MAFDLITRKRHGRDWSCSIDGDDSSSGSWWNPLSWIFSSDKKDDAPPKKSKQPAPSSRAIPMSRADVRAAQASSAEANVRRALASGGAIKLGPAGQAIAAQLKSKSSGIGVTVDALGRTNIVGGRRRTV